MGIAMPLWSMMLDDDGHDVRFRSSLSDTVVCVFTKCYVTKVSINDSPQSDMTELTYTVDPSPKPSSTCIRIIHQPPIMTMLLFCMDFNRSIPACFGFLFPTAMAITSNSVSSISFADPPVDRRTSRRETSVLSKRQT